MGQYWVNDIWLKPDFEALNTQNFQVIILDLLLKNLKTTQGLNMCVCVCVCVCVCITLAFGVLTAIPVFTFGVDLWTV